MALRPTTERARGEVSAAMSQGLRSHQEDRWLAVPLDPGVTGLHGHLLAVLDGHGGAEVADACVRLIPGLFRPRGVADLTDALRRVIGGLDDRTRGMASGTTVSVACVLERPRLVALCVLGDSPVVVLDRDGRTVVGPEHNVRTNSAEREAAVARGGLCQGGYVVNPVTGAGLQIGRALGDRAMGQILSREPEVLTAPLGAESVVVLATDGLLDPSHERARAGIEEMVSLLREDPRADAETLLAWAEGRGVIDNATVVVWRAQS